MESKKCSGKCGEVKPLSEFSKDKTKKDGLSNKCRFCDRSRVVEHQRSIKGKLLKIFRDQIKSQKHRSKASGEPYVVEYTKKEFVEWGLSHLDYIRIHQQWVMSGYDRWLAPSFDRLDDYGSYSFSNFNKWMTWKQNNDKGHIDRLNGNNVKQAKAVRGVHKKTGATVEFYSISEAGRFLGINSKNISECCTGNKNSAGGYTWKYSEINGDRQHNRKKDL